ncbi:HAD family hydrolase [Cellulomonas carbonis]|uniref:Haloacid dehalogenase n=1 Tax=Cellulomonas carbonis T26 TaxID=947969 RepID=A0A0A0BSB5_9CELL|nr:HAD family hydrolase [Cellulomonas carbonis]KGM10044.1 haloacid dehalogenase [Cellulomonas carbonis T26]GGC18275.1 haloacid dehalogenase [Cellulomonas carbonis]
MALAAVIFDLDGTLFDHSTASISAVRAWVESLGRTSSPDLEAAWFDAEERHFRDWCDGLITFTEQRRRRLREVLPLLQQPVGDDAALDRLFADGYLHAYRQAWCAYTDVADCLLAVERSGLRTAVLTNGTVEQQNAKIQAIGLAGRVGPVLTAEELGAAKPAPAAFAAACDRLDVCPSSALYVGDDYEVDVLGARAAGLRAVLIDRAGTGPANEADRMGSLLELAARLT